MGRKILQDLHHRGRSWVTRQLDVRFRPVTESVAEPRWLTDAEYRAWIGYRRMRTRLDLQLARDLASDAGLSEPDYDVLSTVSEAPGRRMRISELASAVLWSKSRASHQITRMQ